MKRKLLLLTKHILVTSSVSAAIVSATTSTKSLSPALISTGLKNLGNTCYLNAQLQCAFHIPAVRRRILVPEEIPVVTTTTDDDDNDDDDEGIADDNNNNDDNNLDDVTTTTTTEDVTVEEVATNEEDVSQSQEQEEEEQQQQQPEESGALLALRQVFIDMVNSAQYENNMPAMPYLFCQRLGINVMEQQDSQEFWKLLLPALGLESLTDLYKGSFEDYITALDGSGRERRREELYLDLSLDVTTSTTVMDSLEDIFGPPELLSEAEGNGWRPEKGADKVDAHKGSSLLLGGLPPILQLHLKRFNYDWQTDVMTKLNNQFIFPETLDLSSLCKKTNNQEEETSDKDNENYDDTNNRAMYDLQSIVIHLGEYGVGHYYSYVRPDIRSDVWYRFNDDQVEQVTFQEVQQDAFGGKFQNTSKTNKKKKVGIFGRLLQIFQGGNDEDTYGWGGSASNAYVIQYVQRCEIPQLYPEE